jgi:hypothetical protein
MTGYFVGYGIISTTALGEEIEEQDICCYIMSPLLSCPVISLSRKTTSPFFETFPKNTINLSKEVIIILIHDSSLPIVVSINSWIHLGFPSCFLAIQIAI